MPAPHRFKPGVSGNPNGRPKGSRNKNQLLLDVLSKDLPKLLAAAKSKAFEGDTAALRLLLDRLIPAKKSESAPVFIENLKKAKTLTEKANMILDEVANGRIPPDIGTSLISAIDNTAKVAEIDSLTKRIEALENDSKEQD